MEVMSIHKISSRKIGLEIEEEACEYLRRNQYHVICRNFVSRYGEIDIVAFDETALVFIEVRYRRRGALVTPAESVTSRKLQRLKLAIRDFLYKYTETVGHFESIRVDLCSVTDSMDKGNRRGDAAELDFQITKGILGF